MEKTKKAPKPTSDRKRPSKTFIQQMATFRGHMTGAEKTQLAGLSVKNALQRINNRAMSQDEAVMFNGVENVELQRLMKEFIRNVDTILKDK